MNQRPEKDNNDVTIRRLVANADKEMNQFFKSAEEQGDVQPITQNAACPPSSSSVGAGEILIEEILRNNNMLVQGSGLGPVFADEYRRIKRPLLSNAFGKTASLLERANLILVTSSIPGEGKTFTAMNLALSIAYERNHTVLLIDCDVTRFATSRMLGIEDRPGLVDLLENSDFSVGDAILRTNVPTLSLISAGKQHGFVTELLASQRMSELMSEIGERYDDRVIIFDGPPMLSTPQTQVLASQVGQVVFVVEAGKTPQTVVEEALKVIPEERATGLVMNKSEGISARSRYYYGYYDKDGKTGLK
ncbi:MAG: XrtA-associated tyrosine autokinase [Gammaproteobacteria bacterium]|nr:XrtA-associated tyrosine autokinase [Gammaproteobacteria bacterium]